MSTKIMTLDAARVLLREVTYTKGFDHQPAGSCRYVDAVGWPEDRTVTPSCIVGHVLAAWGVPVEDIFWGVGLNNDSLGYTGVGAALEEAGWHLTPDAMQYLYVAQLVQDRAANRLRHLAQQYLLPNGSMPSHWGAAYRVAERAYYAGGYRGVWP